MAFGPVISGSTLAKDEIVWTEQLAKRTSPNGVHCARFQIDQYSPGNIFAAARLIVVNVDALQLQVRITVIGACGLNPMLVRNDFPKLEIKRVSLIYSAPGCLCSNLIAALASLDVNNLAHLPTSYLKSSGYNLTNF